MELFLGTFNWLVATSLLSFSGLFLLLATSFVTSFINATIGVGGGVLMLAMLLLLLPAEAVIPVHALIQLLSNIGRTAAFRSNIDSKIVKSFAPGCLMGSIAAAFILVNIPGWLLEIVIGLFIVWTLFGDSNNKADNSGTNHYFGIGCGTSFVSSFVGATGPLVIAFLRRENLSKQNLIGTHGACMTIQHLIKLLAFGVVGISVAKWWLLFLLLGLSGFLGTLAGRKVLFSLSEKVFSKIFKTALVILCIKILGGASVAAAAELQVLAQSTKPNALTASTLERELNELTSDAWWKRLAPASALHKLPAR